MKILLTLFCFLSIPMINAQNAAQIEQLLKQKRTEIDQLQFEPAGSISIVSSSFAQNDMAFKRSIEDLKELTIIKVYYVYTKYRKSASFNQLALDRKRFQELDAAFPEVIADPYIDWEIVVQTGCSSPEMGQTFFHGFVFVHRSIRSQEERLKEITDLENYLKNPTETFVIKKLDILEEQLKPTTGTSTIPVLIPDQQAHFSEGPDAMLAFLKKQLHTDEIALKRDDQWVKTHITVDENGVITDLKFLKETPERVKNVVENAITFMPNWSPAIRDSEPVKSELDLDVRVSYSPSVNGMYLINGDRPSLVGNPLMEKPKDLLDNFDGASTEEIFMKQAPVYKGLEIVDRSERCALVMDVTGSMTENVASMKRWIKANNDSVNFTSFTFFNDGDDKATKKKKIGETGGIYSTFNISVIDDLVVETMRRGSGGERSESDIEALLFTQKNDSLCDAILLIGDNYSEVRDLELLPTVSKKVHVLICSTTKSIRPDYLLIVKNTGGYLIFNGERIELTSVVRDQIVSIGSYQYDYNGREFSVRTTTESSTRM